MKGIKKLKRWCAFTLALLITAGSLLTTSQSVTSNVMADSNSSATERVTNFISLAAGKETQDLDSSLTFTKDELRFLGVYISNFYIPFGTELGTSDADVNTQTSTDIKAALQTSLNFSDDMTEVITENVMGLSRSNCQQLEFRVSKDYHKDYQSVSNFSLNYFNFLRLMLGETTAVFEGYQNLEDKKLKKEEPVIYKDIREGVYTYGYFGYMNNGEFTPMFDCCINGTKSTPSMYSFYQCLASVDVQKGYGTSFFDFTKDEASDDSTLADMLKDMNNDDIYKMSAYGTTINVDCFGNIVLKGGNHQYVAVPGCMNPYTWVSVDSDGNDTYKAGTCYNMVSFQGLGLSDTGNFVESDTAVGKDTKDPNIKSITISDDLMTTQLAKIQEDYGGAWEDFWSSSRNPEGYTLRALRGSTDTKLSANIGFGWGDSDYYKLAQSAELGFKSANKNDYSYYASIDGGLSNPDFTACNVGKRIACWDLYKRSTSTEVRVLDNFIFIDNLGAFGFDNTQSEISYSAIQMEHYLDDSGASPNQLFANWGKDAANGFTNMYKDIQSGKMNTTVTAEDSAIVGTYTTYAIAGLYENTAESKKATIGFLGFRLNTDGLVPISNDPISLPSSVTDNIIDTSIRNWIYYILHPTKGADYVRTLIKTKTNAILVGWHNDMVGTNSVGATTGTTLYRSNTGYVTTPDLSEMQWTSSLINFYNNLIPFLIVMMIVTMLFAYITGVMSLQRCLFGVVIFACFLLTPVNLINGVVSMSNRATQNIYGEKFTYWALIQQESYADALDTAASGGSYSNYLKTLYATNSDVYSNQGSDSVILKWQAPKKMASLMLSSEDTSLLSNLSSTNLLSSVLNDNAYSGESYLDGENSYMYRSYTDIGNFSRFIYNGINIGNQSSRRSLSSAYLSNVDSALKSTLQNMGTTYSNDRNSGYTNKNGDGSTNTSSELRTIVPLTSSMYNDAIGKRGTVKDLSIADFVGINQGVFNFSVEMFNNSSEDYITNLLNNASEASKADLETYLNGYSDSDLTGLASYSLMSESPFYYYSWNLYDMGMSTGANASNGYKTLLLGQDDGGFFYNTSGNGELKDFMDMKSLFTYVIPYLKQGNDLVKEWDGIYGVFVYEGVPTEEGHWNDTDIKNSTELSQKYWHNLNVARLYEIYTPWVDLMYDCDYAKPEKISSMGETYVISDPINPASYPSERPMVFSESEMVDYGLTKGDLTTVERKIIECNQGMEERMYELLNYYNFSDLTLNTAAAINCTFEFNTTFSESGLFSDNINLYPQSFEIADFSYDAFLRFIIANTIGEDMTSQRDFYAELVNNSSWTTALVMLLLDIVSQYILPAFKIFFLIAVFVSSILLILVTSFKVDPEQKFIGRLIKGLFAPMLFFLVVTIGFAWVISLFMGTGNNAVTQTNTLSIQMGDPVVVMLAMLASDIICVLLYFKICKGIISSIKKDFKSVVNYVEGVFGGAASLLGGAIMGKVLGKGISGSSGGTSGMSSSGQSINESGTGRASTRATKRANSKWAEDRQDNVQGEDSTRMNDSKRSTFKENTEKKEDAKTTEKKKDGINEKLSKGMKKMSADSDLKRERTDNKVKDSGINKK